MAGGSKILVVEDDADMREMLVAVLEGRPVHAVGAGSCEEAAQALEEGDFDLVLTDIHLPGADGFEVLAVATRKRTPVVVMTSFGGPAAAEKAKERGAVAFLEKPFDIEQLLGLLAERLHW